MWLATPPRKRARLAAPRPVTPQGTSRCCSEFERDDGPHDADAGSCPVRPPRRSFLRGALGAGVAGAAAGVVAGAAAGAGAGYAYRSSRAAAPGQVLDAEMLAGRLPAVPFHGRYQAGILRKPERQTIVVSFNVTAEGRGELTDLLRTITARARFLTAGGIPPEVGIGGPPADSGVLGPTVVPDGLTVTVGVGSTLFDDRYGLAARKPAGLTPMTPFPNDDLDPAQCGGDLSLQLTAGSQDTVLHALRDIARYTRGGMQVLWRIDGFASPARPAGTTPRNLMGFMDGIANPDTSRPEAMNNLVWVQPGSRGEPAWTAHGSYQVIRLIRMFVEFWDRVDIIEQENMIGRRRDTGAPLDANTEFARPDYTLDPDRGRDPAHRAHPAGQPAHPADGAQPHPAPRAQLRPGRRCRRRPRHGADLHLLPAGHRAPVRHGADPADRRAAGRLHQPVRRRLLLRPARRAGQPRLPGPDHAGLTVLA